MKTSIFMKLSVVTLTLVLVLTACDLFGGQPGTPDPFQISTLAAATVSANMTQIAVDNMSAQLTQMAAGMTQQAVATNTPAPTNTPAATFTPLPPTATPIPPTPTAIPIPCNAASFKGDVTVQDGTTFYASDHFVKTWAVKNVGSCSWTKEYKLFFFGGDQMDGPAAVAFPKTVDPGETVNLSVALVAPADTGSFGGSWMMKAANGTVFGVGKAYNVALTVNIKVASVPKSKDPNTVYDFVRKYCSASWRTNAGAIECPSTGVDYTNGSITRTYAPVLEGGYVDDEGALITVPATGGDGMIRGKFPKLLINSGDHFVALLTCADDKTKCSVTFELQYSEAGSDTIVSLGTWSKNYGDSTVKVDVDLSTLAGKEVHFYLKVFSQGNSTDDMAQWVAARITNQE